LSGDRAFPIGRVEARIPLILDQVRPVAVRCELDRARILNGDGPAAVAPGASSGSASTCQPATSKYEDCAAARLGERRWARPRAESSVTARRRVGRRVRGRISQRCGRE
jgi:hypothetical protein